MVGWNCHAGGIRILLIVAPPTAENGADIHLLTVPTALML